jgi:hypothetical protein
MLLPVYTVINVYFGLWAHQSIPDALTDIAKTIIFHILDTLRQELKNEHQTTINEFI